MEPGFGNFNNIGWAILLLFEIAALEGWPDVMSVAMASDLTPYVQADMISQAESYPGHPIQNHEPQIIFGSFYMVAWVTLGCFVVMNMTIGVVVDTFAKIR